MFDISELKAKTLSDLQVIAKTIGLSKVSQLKKLDLIYKILDTQATAGNAEKPASPPAEKPKRKRIAKPKAEENGATKPEQKKNHQQPRNQQKPTPEKDASNNAPKAKKDNKLVAIRPILPQKRER